MKKIQLKFNKKKTITGLVIAVSAQIIATSVYASSINTVVVSLNDRVEVIKTRATTVSEVLEELNVEINESDYINVSLNQQLDETTKIQWNKAKNISFIFNGAPLEKATSANTVAEFLEENNVPVSENDLVHPALNTEISENTEIFYVQAIPVNIIVDGANTILHTTERTVANFLNEKEITLNEFDKIVPALDEPLTEGGTVEIIRVNKQVVTDDVAIPYNSVVSEDSSLFIGEEKVATVGQPGVLRQTNEQIFENGSLVESNVINEEIAVEAITEVISKGTKPLPIADSVNTINNSNDSNQTNNVTSTTKTSPSKNENNTTNSASAITSSNGNVLGFAKSLLGSPYLFGGTSPKGFDCSGYVQYVFKNSIGKQLPRTASAMYSAGQSVSDPRPGDLVFFKTDGQISHVGIFIGNNSFISSTTSSGIKIDSLSNTYWGPKYVGAKNI